MGGEFGREWIHMYVWLGPFAVHLQLSQQLIGYPQYRKKKKLKKIKNTWYIVKILKIHYKNTFLSVVFVVPQSFLRWAKGGYHSHFADKQSC